MGLSKQSGEQLERLELVSESWPPLDPGALELPSARFTVTVDSPSVDIRLDFSRLNSLSRRKYGIFGHTRTGIAVNRFLAFNTKQ